MAQIIYKTNGSGLIAQGNRSVTTYSSGLIKVEQTFIGLTSNESADRSSLQIGQAFPLDQSPSMDGVFIFPATQESRDANGFTTYNVSGYGRVSDDGYGEFTPSYEFTLKFTPDLIEYFDLNFTANQKLTQRVIFNDQSNEDPYNYDFDGLTYPVWTNQSEIPSIYVNDAISFYTQQFQTARRVDVQRTNFGRFTELRTIANYG